jgi:lysophospholipase L1-like esterase
MIQLRKYLNPMKKIYLLVILLIVVVFGAYLNLSYARIFSKVGKENLKSPDVSYTYLINSGKNNDKSLSYSALGDSLTAGVGVDDYKQSYPYLTAEKLAVKNNIILKDKSAPGFKTEDLKNILVPLVVLDKPDIVTLFIGINDIRSNVSEENFKGNYEQILESLSKNTSAKIYVINIPFLGSSNSILPPYNYYFDFKTKEFNKIIKDLAIKNNVQYIDLYSPTLKEFRKSDSYYSADLFHPSSKGYSFWADIIYDNFN